MRRVDTLNSDSAFLWQFTGRAKLLPWAVCLILFWLGSFAKAASSLTASLDRDTVEAGESVTLTLAFENATLPSVPNLPPISGITVAGVAQSREFTIVNGQSTAKLSFNYTLVTAQPGEITIPAFQIRVDGGNLMSNPLKLKVVKSGTGTTADVVNKTAFLKLIVSKTNLFVGEVLPVDMNLYVVEGREPRLQQLESPGFTVGPIKHQGQSRTRIGNQVFYVVSFKTYVSAARWGQLTLGPASMQLSIPRPNSRRTIFGDVFDWQNINLTSEQHVINVAPIPRTNLPPCFNGAVGSFSMNVAAGPTNVAIGDPITVKVTITGQGLLDSLNLPNQPAWTDFKAYPATSRVEPADPLGISGTKAFEQVVVPQKQEITALPAFQFSFFDPNARAFRTLSGPATPLIVRPTAALTSLPGANPSQSTTITNDEIVHIKPYLAVSPVAGAPLVQQPWFLGLQAVPVLTWLSLLVMRKRNEKLANNPRLRRQREVARKIQEGLVDLRRQAEAQQSDAFFATIFRLLQEQLGERLDLPAHAITEAVIDERLRSRGLPEQSLANLHELFQICNQARFAPQRSSHELASFIPRVETTLKELQNIPA